MRLRHTIAKVALAAEIVAAYGRARWWLWRASLPVTVERIRRPAARPSAVPADPQATALRLARAVGRTLAPLPADSRCLARSLVLTALLNRRGIASTLIIGTRSLPDFAAHAWVEVAGRPVLADGGGEYGPLVEF